MSIISPMNSSVVIDPSATDYRYAYQMMEKGSKKRHKVIYYPISQTTQLIAKTLYLNNYEINKIIASYLLIWNKHPENNFVSKNKLAEVFLPQNRGFVNTFFTDERVNCNDYVLFICFFLFYDTFDIVSVMLAMGGVNSNIIISKDKAKQFFTIFNLTESDYGDLFMLLNQSKTSVPDYKCDTYPMKLFINYFKSSFNFSVVLYYLKQDISKLTLDSEDIYVIENKRDYYNKIIQHSINIEEMPIESNQSIFFLPSPPEPCFSKMFRILFTTKPNPYHYDFFIQIPPDKSKASLLCQIKQKFGYSSRGTSYQSPFTSSRVCLQSHSSSRENSKLKNTMSKLTGKCLSSPSLDRLSISTRKIQPNPA